MTRWAALFSGGKDSSYALYRAMAEGLDVARLVTVHPPADSYMYHVPATRLATLASESIGVPLVEVEASTATGDVADAGAQGDRELEPLEAGLQGLVEEVELTGITAGAVESAYQADRLRGMCVRLGIELYTPLWGEDPRALAEAMLEAGFEIRIIQVAADGLDESWLGRTIDREALRDLERLNERYGVHLLGEGGEYETLVTDGPHMDRPIELEYEVVWDGMRGRLRITDAGLA